MLGVNRNGLAAGKFVHIDAVPAPVKSQLDTVMDQPFALEARADPRFHQQIDGALFEHPGADTLFDVFPAVRFKNDGFDSLEVKKMGEKKTRRACSDNSNLRAQVPPPAVSAGFKLEAV
jgi:hypothetical protein